MMVETEQMVAITKLQKELPRKVKELSESGEPVYILKNNKMEAVIISFADYEQLKLIEEVFEHYEISNLLEERIKDYEPGKNVSWEAVRENL